MKSNIVVKNKMLPVNTNYLDHRTSKWEYLSEVLWYNTYKNSTKPFMSPWRHENKLKVILTFTVNPRAAWATFKKQKGEGDSVKPYQKKH